MNQLYFGDCLDVLKKLYSQYPQGFIDLVYIDPPFNSKRNYNILFESIDIHNVKAQKEAFSDTWSNVSYNDTINEIHELDLNLYEFLKVLDFINVSKSAISYLATMAIRIWYIYKVLKDSGSFYLHCDPTMSHYLKIVCDIIFKKNNFRNEIIWKRHTPRGAKVTSNQFPRVVDNILFYSKSSDNVWQQPFRPFDENFIHKRYRKDENNRLYRDDNIGTYSEKSIKKFEQEGRIYYTKNGKRRLKRYLDEEKGVAIDTIWADIPSINSQAKELLGYPTQKPLALLERIIIASSNEGDLVADFFCGCGTTIAASEKLNRKWLGVDISHLAIQLILKRLIDPYPEGKRKEILKTIEISGFPKDIASAKELAIHTDKHRIKFQDWVVEVLLGGVSNPSKSGDSGVDGHLTFYKSSDGKQKGTGVIEVKSGNVTISMVRSFMTSVDARNADLGIFVCFEEQITDGMRREAKAKGYVEQFGQVGKYKIDKIQIITIEQLMDGIRPKIPSEMAHFNSSNDRLDSAVENEEFFN